MLEAGILTPDDRVELVDGEVLAMTPQGSAHATAVVLAYEVLRAATGTEAHLRVQLPLALGAASEPEPDLAVVAGAPRDYRDGHPQAALLVVEVADTTLRTRPRIKVSTMGVEAPVWQGVRSDHTGSMEATSNTARRDASASRVGTLIRGRVLSYDRDVKGSLYARAGIHEYWIVNLTANIVEVFREPVVNPPARFGWHYRRVERWGPGDSIAPSLLPNARIAVVDILP